jgi:hypothetical protein
LYTKRSIFENSTTIRGREEKESAIAQQRGFLVLRQSWYGRSRFFSVGLQMHANGQTGSSPAPMRGASGAMWRNKTARQSQ